ncbi:hypothetical protein EVAR_85816_1 [Eumeta japonica]|uniref:Uncharacterized protein n=1 Tax=Eumeta variegata TaxID=151549 RepID=A0A4C1URH2_EUMVA|nr:hypothetical protein EVAR_85816_1 [Eumeta japonica]
MRAARAEMQEVRCAISNLASTVGACNGRISDLAARVEAIESRQCQQVTNDVSALEGTMADLRSELNDRDENMLCNNLEIAAIPEKKNESSMHAAYTQRCH